jgi:hypothetical protein
MSSLDTRASIMGTLQTAISNLKEAAEKEQRILHTTTIGQHYAIAIETLRTRLDNEHAAYQRQMILGR